jgi:hypothetical protein
MTFMMSPSPDPVSQIIEFLLLGHKRWGAQHLDNVFNEESNLKSYVVAGTIRTGARFLPVLFGSPPP